TPEYHARERLRADPPCDRLICYNLEGELFFGAEPELENHLAAIEQAARGEVRVVLLVLERARNPDAAFLRLLATVHGQLHQRGVALLLCGVQPDLAAALRTTGADARIDGPRIFCERPGRDSGTRDAVHLAYSLLGDSLCSSCSRRQEGGCANERSGFAV